MWMWAIVPARPVASTLPLTAPSGATVMVPAPVADVLTGGTSWSPLSFRAPCAMAPPAARASDAAIARTSGVRDGNVMGAFRQWCDVDTAGQPLLFRKARRAGRLPRPRHGGGRHERGGGAPALGLRCQTHRALDQTGPCRRSRS